MMTTGDSNREKSEKERKGERERAHEAATNLLSNLYSMLLRTATVRQPLLLHSFRLCAEAAIEQHLLRLNCSLFNPGKKT